MSMIISIAQMSNIKWNTDSFNEPQLLDADPVYLDGHANHGGCCWQDFYLILAITTWITSQVLSIIIYSHGKGDEGHRDLTLNSLSQVEFMKNFNGGFYLLRVVSLYLFILKNSGSLSRQLTGNTFSISTNLSYLMSTNASTWAVKLSGSSDLKVFLSAQCYTLRCFVWCF